MINDHMAFRTDWMPFAGRHESGHGVGGIPWTMKDLTCQHPDGNESLCCLYPPINYDGCE
jgi:hypothetical protein